MNLPQRTAHYEGPLTTTAIWDSFQLRGDDVLVITPPKCGTTWSQIIITSLIAGRPLSPREMGDVSYWLDCELDDPIANMEKFDKQDFRRCIKSHTPLDGVPYDPRCTYIAVYRHPIDVHFSMRTHASHMESDVMRRRYPDDPAEAFRMFLEDELYDGSNDALDLHSIAYHFASFKKWEHLPNVHLFHYADMKADLGGTVARFARILGMDENDPLVDQIAQDTSFASLKKKAIEGDKTAEGDGFYLASKFFHSGTSNKWEGKLSSDQLAAFDARMKALLPDNQAAWLLWGSKGRP
jgi:aryl sulfotransferase